MGSWRARVHQCGQLEADAGVDAGQVNEPLELALRVHEMGLELAGGATLKGRVALAGSAGARAQLVRRRRAPLLGTEEATRQRPWAELSGMLGSDEDLR